MAIALQKLEPCLDGVNKMEFEESLQELSNQIRILDQKLMMRTENELTIRYENQQYEIRKVKEAFNQIKK